MLVWERVKGAEGGATEAGPEEDFVDHCDCEWVLCIFVDVWEVYRTGLRGGHSLNRISMVPESAGLVTFAD